MKIGILDGQSIQALIFSKQLKGKGHDVILFCSEKLSYGYFTRYASKKIICPSSQEEGLYHEFILSYLKNNQLDVLIPMNDYSAKYLSSKKDVLSGFVNFVIPDYKVFMKGYNKNLLMQVCRNNKFPHPQTLDLEQNITTVDKINFKFPALIKPNETTGARGFTLVKDFEELQKVYPNLKMEFGDCHLQEYIPEGGRQFKVQILFSNKKLLLSTVMEKDRFYPLKGGSSCFNRTIVNDSLVNLCLNVLYVIEWEGFADFDLIEDPRDGSILIMEINPRVPACIKASVVSGIDFPNAIVNLSLDRFENIYDYMPGKFLRYFSMDLLWLLKSENKIKNFFRWSKNMFSKNHYFQDGDFLDPMPFIIGSFSGFLKQLSPEFRKQKKGMN